jgi:hypothetical protein
MDGILDIITTIFVCLLFLERIAAVVVNWTKTTKDNELLAKYKKAKTFVLTHSGGVFDIVKLLFDTGVLKGDGLVKMEEFKKKLAEQYLKIEGEPMPEGVLSEAELIAESIYAGKKLVTASTPAVEVSKQE